MTAATAGAANAAARGRRALAVGRAAGMAFIGVALAAFVAAIPVRWAHLTQPSPVTLANLRALGLPVSVYAVYLLALEIVFTAVFVAVGLLIFVRRVPGRMALLASCFLVAYGVGNQTITPVVEALRGLHPAVDFLANSLAFAAWVGFGWFLLMFPNGRFAPAWMRWLAVIWFVFCIPYNYAIGTPYYPMNWPQWLSMPVMLGSWLSWLGSQVYRYWRVSGPLERQQTKWVVFGLSAIILAVLVEIAGIVFWPNLIKAEWLLGEEPASPLGLGVLLAWLGVIRLVFLSLPITIAFSILRYRLWDIDALINRALVYGALTGALALVYFGSVVILQGILGALATGAAQTPLAVVASTLAIAALFAPLRRRIQEVIDRRFYRRKYDAAQTLAAFSRVARDETDLDRLAGELVGVVNETVQPAHASLWLRPPASARPDRTA